jgi:hypothetical protein
LLRMPVSVPIIHAGRRKPSVIGNDKRQQRNGPGPFDRQR